MQSQVSIFFPILYLFSAANSAVVPHPYSYYGESSDSEWSEVVVVGSGDGSVDPLADLDAEGLTTEIVTMETTITPTPSTTTTKRPQIRVRVPQTCCELGALAARQGYSCRPESHREKLRAHSYRSERLGNHLYKTKNANQVAREDHKRVEAQLRNFSKCITGINRKMEEDFVVCCKRTSVELFDEEPRRKQASRRPYLGYYYP